VSGRLVVIIVAGLLVVAGAGLAIYVIEQPGQPPATDRPPAVPERTDAPAEPAEAEDAPPTPPVARPAEPLTAAEESAEAIPTTGSLRIVSDVPDTSVFVDRVHLGMAPVTKADLTPGPHTVVLSPTGYEYATETVEVVAGEVREVSVSFKTIKLDAAITVVHKHTFGSCTGILRASPEGLVYETTDDDDRFILAFGDVETFEVDYLATNLRVKVRDGKTYNFTDPEDNADRLFVFHRDVEAVRRRVAGGLN
jgi:hypothetical protein